MEEKIKNFNYSLKKKSIFRNILIYSIFIIFLLFF